MTMYHPAPPRSSPPSPRRHDGCVEMTTTATSATVAPNDDERGLSSSWLMDYCHLQIITASRFSFTPAPNFF